MEQIAKILADLFGPMAEISVFDKGGGMPVKVLHALSHRQQDLRLQEPYTLRFETLQNGTEVKTAVIVGEQILRIRLDLSATKALQSQLDHLVGRDETPSLSLEAHIDSFLKKHQVTLAGMARDHKKKLICSLKDAGLFNSEVLARKLGTSRATIYNYLAENQSC